MWALWIGLTHASLTRAVRYFIFSIGAIVILGGLVITDKTFTPMLDINQPKAAEDLQEDTLKGLELSIQPTGNDPYRTKFIVINRGKSKIGTNVVDCYLNGLTTKRHIVFSQSKLLISSTSEIPIEVNGDGRTEYCFAWLQNMGVLRGDPRGTPKTGQ